MKKKYNETFLFLDKIASEKDVILPFAYKDIYYSLVCFCEENAVYSQDIKSFCFEGSIRFFSDKFNVPKRVIQEAFSCFLDIGILTFVDRTPKFSAFYLFCPYFDFGKE